MCNHKVKVFLIFFLLYALPAFCLENTETSKQEIKPREVATLGQITSQRALLESLKLELDIKSNVKKIQELEAPTIINTPLIAPDNLINALAVPPNSSTSHAKETASPVPRNGNRLLAVQGTDNSNLTAKIFFQGRTFTLQQGAYFSGERVKISRSNVSFGNTILTLE